MNSMPSKFNGRSVTIFLLAALIVVVATTSALADAQTQPWDPALAWEGETTGFQLFNCEQIVAQNYEVIKSYIFNQYTWDPALAWEGEECLAR